MRPALLLLVAAAVLAAAENDGAWEGLLRLRPGHRIVVVDTAMKSHQGTLADVDDSGISVESRDGRVVIERSRVLRVTSLERSRRARNALIGLAAGAAVGALSTYLAVRADQPIARFRGEYWGPYAAAVLLPCLGGGAAVGAVIPSHPTLYRAPALPPTIRPPGPLR